MTVPGGYVAGDTLTAANLNLLPGGKMGYAQVTADQATITAVADLTSLTVTWTAVAARRYRISFYGNGYADSVADTSHTIEILVTDSSNNIKCKGALAPIGAGSAYSSTLMGSVTETGLSGSTTRKLRGRSTSSSGDSWTLSAGATYPAYILCEDIGPA